VRAIRERRGGEAETARTVADPVTPPAGSAKERRNAIAETVAARSRRPSVERVTSEVAPRPDADAPPQAPQEVKKEPEPVAEALHSLSDEGLAEDLAPPMEAASEVSRRAQEAGGLAREELQIAPAPLGRRIGAALIDLGVIAFCMIPFVAGVEVICGDFSSRSVRLALVGIALAIGALYETILLSGAGRTVGMAAAGLLALDARTMDVPSAGQAVRHLVGSVLGAVPLFFGFLWALFDRERRTFADLVSGIVVKRVAASVYESQEVHAPWLYRPTRR
jgi:uncharacterized RDD family membrane protein YckC